MLKQQWFRWFLIQYLLIDQRNHKTAKNNVKSSVKVISTRIATVSCTNDNQVKLVSVAEEEHHTI